MFYFTREEKRIFLSVGLVILLGICFRYIAEIHPPMKGWTDVMESDRLYPKLDVNSATPEELVAVPHVGRVIADRIVDFRQTHGPFTDLDQLNNVSGIGPAKLKTMRKYLKPLP
jgi:competence ComEA-like helix-hairpin-helix protein